MSETDFAKQIFRIFVDTDYAKRRIMQNRCDRSVSTTHDKNNQQYTNIYLGTRGHWNRPSSADANPCFSAAPLTIHPISPPPILLTIPLHKRRRPTTSTFQEIQQQPSQPSLTSPSPLPTSHSPKPRPTSTLIPTPHSNNHTKHYSTTP